MTASSLISRGLKRIKTILRKVLVYTEQRVTHGRVSRPEALFKADAPYAVQLLYSQKHNFYQSQFPNRYSRERSRGIASGTGVGPREMNITRTLPGAARPSTTRLSIRSHILVTTLQLYRYLLLNISFPFFSWIWLTARTGGATSQFANDSLHMCVAVFPPPTPMNVKNACDEQEPATTAESLCGYVHPVCVC